MVNTKALRYKMIQENVSYEDLSESLNLAVTTVRQKISNYRPMFLTEAEIIQRDLKICDNEFRYYFFNHDRNKNEY